MLIVAAVVGTVFTLFGLGVIAYAVAERRWLRAFAGRAVTTEAMVDRVKATKASGSGHPGRLRFRYRAVVQFRLPDGTLQRATMRWPTESQPRTGEPMLVRVDPVRPKRVVAAAGAGSRPPSTGVYVGLGVGAIVIGWILVSVLRAIA